MYKNCRILDKNTNQNYYGQIDTEFEDKDFYELVEIPDDSKNYTWEDGEIKEYILQLSKEEQIIKIRNKTDLIISTPQLFLDKYTFCLDDVDSLNSLSDLMEFQTVQLQEKLNNNEITQEEFDKELPNVFTKKILDKANVRHTVTIDELNELVRTMGSIKDKLILDRDDKIESLQI